MEINVEMLAFMEGESRTVSIPDDVWREACERDAEERSGIPEVALDRVFHYGQNDVQNVAGRCSVSVGDVAEIDGKFFRVDSIGFSPMSAEELERYVQIPRRDRYFWQVDEEE